MRITSTDDVDVKSRLEYWESWNQTSLVGLRCSTPRPDTFSALSLQREIAGATVTRIRAARHIIDRNANAISAEPKRSLFVSILLTGKAFIYHEDGMQAVMAGDTLVYSTMHPYLIGFDQTMDLLIIDIDESVVFGDWGLHAVIDTPEITAPTATTRLIAAETLRLLESSEAQRFETGERLLAYCRQHVRHERSADALYAQALSIIEANVADPDFTAQQLAERMHVSERHLRRVFAEREASPGAVVLARRLDETRQLLSSRPDMTITDIATATGFNSPSSFTRSFRTHYGCSPSEYRRG